MEGGFPGGRNRPRGLIDDDDYDDDVDDEKDIQNCCNISHRSYK